MPTDTCLFFDCFYMSEEMLIARRQNTDHSEMWRFEPCLEVHRNIAPLSRDIIRNHADIGFHSRLQREDAHPFYVGDIY